LGLIDNRPVTIREVAADAGVGTATVSRALNEPWRVSPDTIERVKASIGKLGYKPNFRARLLARGNSGTVCFLLSNRPFIHSVHGQILQGAASEADLLGVQIVYASCTYSADVKPSQIKMPQILAARGLIDGVIVAGTNYPNLIPVIEELELPYVIFGTNYCDGSGRLPNAVYVDEQEGGYQAARHLLGLGHTKIAFIGDVSLPWYAHRYQGFALAMSEAGIGAPKPIGSAADGAVEMGVRAARQLCESKTDFTAIFAGGDRAAYGAMRMLRKWGVSVPDDVSIVGFDDDEVASMAEPPLTTVRVPTEEIGARCVLMLNDMIRAGAVPEEPAVLPAELVVRASTAAPKK